MQTNQITSLLVLTSTLLAAGTARAATSTYTDRGTWEAAVGVWIDVDLASHVGDGDTLTQGSTLVLPNGTDLSFSEDLEGRQVPGSFATWSGGQTPRVLLTAEDVSELGGTFGAPMRAFGLEMQPDVQDSFQMTLTLNDGSTLQQTVDGSGGAQFFGWLTSGSATVLHMTLSIDAQPGDQGFAIGRLVLSPTSQTSIPDVAPSWLLMAAALGSVTASTRLRTRSNR